MGGKNEANGKSRANDYSPLQPYYRSWFDRRTMGDKRHRGESTFAPVARRAVHAVYRRRLRQGCGDTAAPDAFSAAISGAEYPASARISSVCIPNHGAGGPRRGGVADRRAVVPE